MRKYKICLWALVLMIPLGSYAQETGERPGNEYQVAVHPTYAFTNGLRVDVERRFKNHPANWLMLGLTGYWAFRNEDGGALFPFLWNSDLNSIRGLGAEATFKHFIGYPHIKFLFVAAGASFSYYDLRYDDYVFNSFKEDGLLFYEESWEETNHAIPKLGGHLSIGFQLPTRSRVFVDGTVGWGYNYSFYNKDKYIPDSYQYIYGLDRRGFYPTATFRIGVRLGRL